MVALHVLFGLAESVGWSAMARRFGYDREKTEVTRALALNQGAYNLGVAALLAWALVAGQTPTVVAVLVFVVAMGAVGAVSVRRGAGARDRPGPRRARAGGARTASEGRRGSRSLKRNCRGAAGAERSA